MPGVTAVSSQDQNRIVPANEATWDDLQSVLAGEGSGCQCQFFKLDNAEWHGGISIPDRRERLRQQTQCDQPRAASTSGLIAYVDGEPAGWCAVEPRTAYPRLLSMRVPWSGRSEDKNDGGVWAVTCFVVRKEYRRRGIASALAVAAVDFARERGARAIEGYPKNPSSEADAGEVALYVGSRALFAAAGYREVSRPSPRRVVMRIDL
jgi:GNAT superfamily N-acetyltransferase